MSKFIASWLATASEVMEAEFGPPVLLLPGAAISESAARFTLMVDLAGDWGGTFTATVDETALTALLAQAGGDAAVVSDAEAARELWQALFRKICIAAAANVGASSGHRCEVAMISPEDTPVGSDGMGYQLHAGGAMAALTIADQVELAAPEPSRPAAAPSAPPPFSPPFSPEPPGFAPPPVSPESRGIDLLRGVGLEASLRFGSREMALSDLLGLGPGDVIQLDRALADPVDLVIGDKIVARGEVVLVNGNFGIQVTEVAEPRKSLESVRCLF